jgi:hypothetical protein
MLTSELLTEYQPEVTFRGNGDLAGQYCDDTLHAPVGGSSCVDASTQK